MMEDKRLTWKCRWGRRDALRQIYEKYRADWKDPASLVADKLTYYEDLPDDLFQLPIPPGATVVEQ